MIQLVSPSRRKALQKDALKFEFFTIGYNILEGIIAVSLGLYAGSIALLSFGFDSGVEVMASFILVWRLTRHERDAEHTRQLERRAVLLVGISFWILGSFIGWQALEKLITQEAASPSWGGIILAIASIIVMPWLAHRKKKIAAQLESRALSSEANQTSLCAYLSAALLIGLTLNMLFGWWWADPVTSLVIVAVMFKEGYENLEVWRGKKDSCSCC